MTVNMNLVLSVQMQRALQEIQYFTETMIELDASPELTEAWQRFIAAFFESSVAAVCPVGHENN